MKTYFIGTDGEKVVSSEQTQKQIDAVRALKCALRHDGQAVTWDDVDNPEKPRTIFQSILGDRKMRVDEKTLMADRPAFAVVTEFEGKAVRLEYYEGHDALELVFDVRSKELEGKKMPNWMDADPHAYDPVKFLKEAFGMPEDFTKPIIEEIHKK